MRQAVILAAGRGARMGSHTEERPKPMIVVGGKPLLEHILERLEGAGVERAFIVTGYKAEVIETHFAGFPMPLTFRRQEVIDGTARATLLARDWTRGEPFLLTYGDCLAESGDYRRMFEALERDAGASAVIAAQWVDDPWQGAAIHESGGRVTRIVEKPARGTSATHWNSAGVYVFRNEVFAEIEQVGLSARGEYELTSAVEQWISRGSKLLLHGMRGGWRDVGRPEDLAAAEGLVDLRQTE